jgi:hypothetical protein
MSAVKVAVACGLVALLVSACGIPQKPEAGTANLKKQHGFYGHTDDPRIKHANCLRADRLPVHEYYTAKGHVPAIQIGSLPAGPTIVFYSTAGIAQGLQIQGHDEGAEAIGSALLFPNNAPGTELTKIEACTSIGVSG